MRHSSLVMLLSMLCAGSALAQTVTLKFHTFMAPQSNVWRDMQPTTQPPTNKNDAVLTYDPVHRVVLAIIKVTTGEDDAAQHELQTWSYDGGTNAWQRMLPSAEPEPSGNRARNLVFAPEWNLAILENCPSKPREQQIWTYRYGPSDQSTLPSDPKLSARALVEDAVVKRAKAYTHLIQSS